MLNRYNQIISSFLLLSSMIFSQYYTVDLTSTGNSQLTILSDSITGLEIGDEIGIFDESAITNYNDCTNQIGELLVGAGVWDGSQLSIISIGSVDMCAFGGTQLSGFVEDNPVVVKVWRESEQMEYTAELAWGTGSGVFGDIIQSVSEILLTDPNACEDNDEDGICDDVDDCVGAYDDCGICNGDGIAEGACDCDGNLPDCAGECGGTAENCPDWEDCPSCYENTASMTAIVLDALSGDQMYDENDILAAFDANGNVRGVALHLYPVPFGPYEGTGLYEIQIRSDEAGDGISFKYYDASEDEILDSGTGYTFVIDDIIGSVVTPHEISVGAVQLNIDIASGWNWFSLNVEGDMGIGSVMGSLSSTDGDFIKSQSASSTYYPDFGWYGGLDEFGVTGMYKFDSANEDELVFSGAPVDPNTTPIALAAGWNWLGFTPQHDGPIGDALGSATTTAGDFIKNQAASSTYYGEENGWYGGLGVMAPTEGYMLDVAESSTLTYPDFGADDALTRATSAKDMPIAVSDWEVDYHDYEFNGHITMSIDSREDSYGDYIAVFVGDECRGVAERMYFPFGDSYMYSLMVYSNETGGETFTFKYYDSAIGEIVEYAETIDFTSDMIVGDGFNTYSLSREASDMQQPIAYGISDAYPNPFNPVTSFTYSLPEDGFVQIAIYDINGKMVSELTNGYTLAGSYPLVWNANNLSSGIYFIQMYSGDFASTQKIMLVK